MGAYFLWDSTAFGVRGLLILRGFLIILLLKLLMDFVKIIYLFPQKKSLTEVIIKIYEIKQSRFSNVKEKERIVSALIKYSLTIILFILSFFKNHYAGSVQALALVMLYVSFLDIYERQIKFKRCL
jgi:small-conductance mechanosensitive channel